MTKADDRSQPLRAEVVTARLRQLARLSLEAPPSVAPIEMSSSAVTNRLLECAEISALAWQLGACVRAAPDSKR